MNTLQTEAPIRHLSMNNTNRPLDTLLWWASPEHGLDMDQPYQRGEVWGIVRKRNLIRSLLLGVPIPSLVINDRFKGDFWEHGWNVTRCQSNAVIDGKQRITAILGFLHDGFPVPASWFEPQRIETTEEIDDGPYVRYGGLSVVGQRFFRNHTIAISEGQVATLAEEKQIFDLVNFGGVPQGERDDDA